MFTPILGQELERREHHRHHWWVVLGLVAVLAGEETTAAVWGVAGPAMGCAEASATTETRTGSCFARGSQNATWPAGTKQPVSNLYWRDLESARATTIGQIAAQRRRCRFDTDLRAYLAGFLRAPTG